MPRSSAAARDDRALLRATVQLVARAQQLHHRYAGSAIPLGSADMRTLLARAACDLHWIEASGPAKAITGFPLYGRFPVGVRSDLKIEERQFALRHELAHILAGDATEPVRMVHRDYLTYPERVADLFALADLFPTPWFLSLRRARVAWKAIRVLVEREIREEYGPDWPWARVDDRTTLRMRLFRECGI